MSRAPSELKQAIQGLGIGKKFELRSPKPLAFQAPEVRQLEPPQSEVPHAAHPQFENAPAPSSGFFRLAHSTFGDPRLRDLTGEAFRVFLWLSSRAWQFPDSDGRLRASVSYIQRGLGSSAASIERALRALQAQGLLRLVVRDFKLGNLWEVSPKAADRGPPGGNRGRGEVPQEKAPQIEDAQAERAAPSDCAGSSVNLKEQVPQVEAEVRTFKNSQHHQEHTPRAREAAIRDFGPRVSSYLERPMPVRQRDREARAFAELRLAYSPDEIDRAVTWVRSNGLPGSGQAVHSPLQFLTVGIGSVPGVSEQRDRAGCRTTPARIDQEVERAARAFATTHPTKSDQQAVIAAYQSCSPGLRLGGRLLRELAIAHWWSSVGRAQGGASASA